MRRGWAQLRAELSKQALAKVKALLQPLLPSIQKEGVRSPWGGGGGGGGRAPCRAPLPGVQQGGALAGEGRLLVSVWAGPRRLLSGRERVALASPAYA